MERDKAAIYLLAATELDRRAFRLLLGAINYQVDLESDFSAVAVWEAMRSKPRLALTVADHASGAVRDALQMIPRLCADTRILAVSASVEEPFLKEWRGCKLDGYVVKDGGADELREAIRVLFEGGSYFSAGTRETLSLERSADDMLASLSRRESELFPLLAKGLTLREAAAAMTVSYKTADSYRTSLLRKLGVRDRVELARLAIRKRIIEP